MSENDKQKDNQSEHRDFIAHVRAEKNNKFALHYLDEHLEGTAKLASQFADTFNNGDWARVAAIWHDLGKYQLDFQRRIKFQSGFDPDAHLEGSVGRIDHSTAGAIHAIKQFGNIGRIFAYLIAGHHTGLPDWSNDENTGSTPLVQRLKKEELLVRTLAEKPPEKILKQACPISKPPGPPGPDMALWLRLIFSTLVDADFLDTEAFMDGKKASLRSIYPTLAELAIKFAQHMATVRAKDQSIKINQIRNNILDQCEAAAELPPGIFSLTVPTGGGKTLSSMAFALKHALKHNLRRVIYVIPYTSIIEQTAKIFHDIFGDAVIEHHSNLDPDKETAHSRLACENWDAPIVVTTSVQFFESLFANRPSRVRKLHNIVNSVVILDEAQLLPPDFLKPILKTVQELQLRYGVTFVLCTATQPALERVEGSEFPGLINVKEIIPDPLALHNQLKRVTVKIPLNIKTPSSWEDIAAELQQYPSVLCIVNRRDDCRDLHRLMPAGTIHLSALMCGEHRSKVIKEIKDKLKDKKMIRVISTQLVEAGVDIDFPVVYRALAGLDSIAQAAGRCNREGLLAQGQVFVFVPPRPAPAGHLRMAQQCCADQLAQGDIADPLAPEQFTKFFRTFYWIREDRLDRFNILDDLKIRGSLEIRFCEAARKFRIIDEAAQVPVIVRYSESPKWIKQLENQQPTRWLLRKLQRYIVNIPCFSFQKLCSKGEIAEVGKTGLYEYRGKYDDTIGLQISDSDYYDPDSLVVC